MADFEEVVKDVVDALDITKGMHRGQTAEQTQDYINQELNTVILDATNQVADGCMQNQPKEDQTVKISARDSVLSTDAKVYEAKNNPHYAGQVDHHQHLLVNERLEANKQFNNALESLNAEQKINAIRTMNLIEMMVFKNTLNQQEVLAINNSESGKRSIAELRVSEAKIMLAGQINSGKFVENLALYAGNGMQATCYVKNEGVVDFTP